MDHGLHQVESCPLGHISDLPLRVCAGLQNLVHCGIADGVSARHVKDEQGAALAQHTLSLFERGQPVMGVADGVIEHDHVDRCVLKRDCIKAAVEFGHARRAHLQLNLAQIQEVKAQIRASVCHVLGHGAKAAACIEHNGARLGAHELKQASAVRGLADIEHEPVEDIQARLLLETGAHLVDWLNVHEVTP